MKKINLFLVYLISFIYLEFLYKLLVHNDLFNLSILSMIIFLIVFSFILYILGKLGNEKVNIIIYIIVMSIILLWFTAQYVVKSYFDFNISLSSFSVADQLGHFLGKVFIETIKRLGGIILISIPLILGIVFRKYINFERNNYKHNLVSIGIVIIGIGSYLLCLNINKKESYSAYELFYKINDINLTIDNFGVLNTFFIDLGKLIIGFEEELIINSNLNYEVEEIPPEEEEIVYEYNNLDIDFDSLIKNETDSKIVQIHEYMKSDTGTLKNEYTGMFEGKNLILFMAESFNEIAVNKDLTPTLYKLTTSGFVFENFYTPTIYSTIGGEFQELTGLYASSAEVLSKFRSGNIKFPQGIGNVFNNLEYSTYAYHNNSYTFQDRNKYLKSLDFNNFLACGNGLEKLINCKVWPQSDVEMIESTVNNYINEDNFMVFYATVSGHSQYDWTNYQAKKNKDEYLSFNFNYSEGPSSYLAAHIELDKALELLIEKLDEAGVLEDTVIALVGDHYPYELTIDEINEISSYKKDDKVEVNRSNFILWNSEMDTVNVTKVGSQLDVIPTIYNLFGIDYDSRLFVGKDILSTEGGIAIFDNRSWVTDYGTYYAKSKEFVLKDGLEVSDNYVSLINGIVNNKIIMSKMIIDNNYYKKVIE